MVISCCAYGCTERFVKGGPYTFHSFPKDEKVRMLWEEKLRRKNFKATNYTKICSKHFTDDCFDKEKFGGTWLKPDAVPSIFDFPEHLIPKKENKTPPREQQLITAVQYVETNCPSYLLVIPNTLPVHTPSTSADVSETEESKPKRYCYLGDFSAEDMHSPTKACKFLNMAKEKVTQQRLQMKYISRKKKLLEKRVASLELTLQELKQKSLMSNHARDALQKKPRIHYL